MIWTLHEICEALRPCSFLASQAQASELADQHKAELARIAEKHASDLSAEKQAWER